MELLELRISGVGAVGAQREHLSGLRCLDTAPVRLPALDLDIVLGPELNPVWAVEVESADVVWKAWRAV